MTLTASAKPFVWARAGDAQTLDPHAFNEGMTLTLSHQIYEPLLIRDNTGKVQPALATSWTQSIDPLVWVFTLRSGVTFHDGQPLTVDDVIFSLNRALRPTSDLRTRLQGVK
ncbi:MAG: ABC transporter substrate-binding protein, partial [Alphaproteobacteria bacterium]|nr:ABC transporter substrate-binding protein [Alphaproteobacteria bacterium]